MARRGQWEAVEDLAEKLTRFISALCYHKGYHIVLRAHFQGLQLFALSWDLTKNGMDINSNRQYMPKCKFLVCNKAISLTHRFII